MRKNNKGDTFEAMLELERIRCEAQRRGETEEYIEGAHIYLAGAHNPGQMENAISRAKRLIDTGRQYESEGYRFKTLDMPDMEVWPEVPDAAIEWAYTLGKTSRHHRLNYIVKEN